MPRQGKNKKKGYKIVERNFRTKFGEVDKGEVVSAKIISPG
jgi:Holliday junction resolvase-like predicted endonuclease